MWPRRVFVSKPGLYTIRKYPPRSVWWALSQLPLFSQLPTCPFTPTILLHWGTRRPSSYLNISFLSFILLGLNGDPHKIVHPSFYSCDYLCYEKNVVSLANCPFFLILNVLLCLLNSPDIVPGIREKITFMNWAGMGFLFILSWIFDCRLLRQYN